VELGASLSEKAQTADVLEWGVVKNVWICERARNMRPGKIQYREFHNFTSSPDVVRWDGQKERSKDRDIREA
jgi:hypothetical protein